MTTAAVLALIAGVLAWPVPRLLAAARWPHRCPRAAIVLWQAVGLAGGVSALLAAVAVTVTPLSPGVLSAMGDHARNVAHGDPLAGLGWINLVGLAVVAALGGRLFGVLGASTAHTLRERRRHRRLVDLAGRRHQAHRYDNAHLECGLCDHDSGNRVRLRILDHPVAVAYCVPGVRTARVVVSLGLLDTLAAAELDAVLAHEQAHVNGRHDLVIQPFVAWQRTFPFLRPAREATAAVSLLVEMLADDAAARRTDGRTLARALARLGVTRAPVPSGALSILGTLSILGAQGVLGAQGILGAPAPSWARPVRAAVAAVRGSTAATAVPDDGPDGGVGTAVADLAWDRVAAPEVDATGVAALRATGPVPTVDPARSPVVARIARLLDPPAAPWSLRTAVYLAAAAVLATPPLALFL